MVRLLMATAIDTVLVTGATGRIGPRVVDRLRTEYRVVGNSRSGGDVGDEHLRGDMTDPGDAYGVLARSDADAVVHLGMLSNPDETPGHVTFRSTVDSTYHILEASAALGVESVVLASSMSALGAGFDPDLVRLSYLPIDEDHPLTPRDPYGLAKQVMEVTADGIGRRAGAPTITSLRTPWMPREAEVRAAFVESDRSLAAVRDHESYHAIRNTLFAYLHAADAADLIARAVAADHAGHEVVWAAAADTTVELPTAELVAAEYPEVETTREFEGYESLVSTAKARDLLGWEPERGWRGR
jgi:nucleoside-diphosphate-sugar epimerase